MRPDQSLYFTASRSRSLLSRFLWSKTKYRSQAAHAQLRLTIRSTRVWTINVFFSWYDPVYYQTLYAMKARIKPSISKYTVPHWNIKSGINCFLLLTDTKLMIYILNTSLLLACIIYGGFSTNVLYISASNENTFRSVLLLTFLTYFY